MVVTAGEPQRAWYLVLTGTLDLSQPAPGAVALLAAPGLSSKPSSALALARGRLRAAAAAAALATTMRPGAGVARSGHRWGASQAPQGCALAMPRPSSRCGAGMAGTGE